MLREEKKRLTGGKFAFMAGMDEDQAADETDGHLDELAVAGGMRSSKVAGQP